MSWCQCSKCWRIFSFAEFMKLPADWIDKKHKSWGREAICTCGARFHKDRWQLKTKIDQYTISTVHLQIAHSNNSLIGEWKEQYFFETMIHDDEKNTWLSFQVRYKHREEAESGHKFTVEHINDILANPDKNPQDIFTQFFKAVGAPYDRERRNNKL